MNKYNAKDFLPLVQALMEGKTIQYNRNSAGKPDWDDLVESSFADSPSRYRVKPLPVEVYTVLFNGRPMLERFDSLDKAKSTAEILNSINIAAYDNYRAVTLREVVGQ
jgi:hypothetical protein